MRHVDETLLHEDIGTTKHPIDHVAFTETRWIIELIVGLIARLAHYISTAERSPLSNQLSVTTSVLRLRLSTGTGTRRLAPEGSEPPA